MNESTTPAGVDRRHWIWEPAGISRTLIAYVCIGMLVAPSVTRAEIPPPRSTAATDSARDILLNKARSLEGRGRSDLAAQTWKQVLLIDAQQPEALGGLARYAKQQGKLDEARQWLDKLKKVNPSSGAIQQVESTRVMDTQRQRLDQADKLARGGRAQEAMQIYREVFGDAPPAGGWALAYHETDAATPGGWERATQALHKLTVASPNAFAYKLALGRLWTYRAESRMNGIRMLESIPEASVQYPKAREAWRQALAWEGSNPAAAASLRAYLNRHSDAELARNVTNRPPVVERSEKSLATTPDEQLAFEELNKGQILAAEAKFEAVLKQRPQSPGALAGMGFIRMKQEEFSAALKYLEKAQAVQPGVAPITEAIDTSTFYLALREGTRMMNEGQLDGADAKFQQASRMRPKDAGAQRALAGLRLKQGKAGEAVETFEKLITADSNSLENWRGLIAARYQASGAKGAMETARSAPPAVRVDLERSAEYLGLMASAAAELGQTQESNAFVERATAIARANNLPLPNTLLLQVAGSNLNQGNLAKAGELYHSVMRADPFNLVATEGLLAVLLQRKEEKAAFDLVEKMPKELYATALKRPGFLRMAALVQARHGKPEQAETLLTEMIRQEGSDKVPVGVQIQLAEIWQQNGRGADAERLLRELLIKNGDDSDLWRTLLMNLQSRGMSETALHEASRMPALVSGKLNADPDYLSFMAGINGNAGNTAEAAKLIELALKSYEGRKLEPPTDLLLQQGWILLNTKAEERKLYAVLNRLSFHRNLTKEQDRSYSEIWSIWARRRADEARLAGDMPRAAQILEAALRVLPKENAMKGSLAGLWLQAGEPKKALAIYKAWQMTGADANDYAGAVGAAMGESTSLAQKWIQEGLKKFPQSPKLMTLSGQLAADRGDFKKAEITYRAALALAGNEEVRRAAGTAGTDGNQDPRRSLAAVLLNDSDSGPAGSESGVELSNGEDLLRAINGEAPRVSGTGNAFAARTPADDRTAISDRLQALESRNTPYMGIEGTVANRTGNAGFESRMLQETAISSSLIVADAFRLALVARPTLLQTGAQDGTAQTLRLGLAPQGTTFGAQSQSGLAAEMQLSTTNFGLRAGMSPQSFLVKNYIGGLRFRPGGGPITLTLERDNIKDSMLSFAGVRDPVTKQVFGGAISNRAGMNGNWGTVRRGVYVSGGYQKITGTMMQANQRYDGGGGMYYQILSRGEGALTTGLNVFVMSYEKNLRYYTIGHGGYFSPQMYTLINVPVQWSGTYQNRFQYSVNVSLGTQSFREDASPFFPTMQAIQGANGPYYSSQQVSSASYALDFKGLYQLNTNWFLGFFVNMNNSRNFQSQTVGFALKYAFKPKPLGSAFDSTTIPDWKGTQPFSAN